MDKKIKVRTIPLTFNIWDVGQCYQPHSFVHMMVHVAALVVIYSTPKKLQPPNIACVLRWQYGVP